MTQPVVVGREVRAGARIKAQRVGGDPFDAALLLEELDGLHVKTGEVIPALVIQAEELAGIADAGVPPAEQGNDGAGRDRPMLLFPGLEIIRRELGVRVASKRGANIHDDQRPNQLFGGDEVGARALVQCSGASRWVPLCSCKCQR